jgi:uncharacterized membrane protein
MGIKITIDDHEVKNPFAKAIVGLIAIAILLIVLVGVFLLLLPFLWFAVLSIVLLVLVLLFSVSGNFAALTRKGRLIEKGNSNKR